MGKFRVVVSKTALKDIKKHLQSGNKPTIRKIEKILIELESHPYEGTGKPEPLKYNFSDKWSRRINEKDRKIYVVKDHIVQVEVLSAMGHYLDK